MFNSTSSPKFSPIPRSRSEFCYISLTPKEKRRSTDFTHLLPQFNRDLPYARLQDPKSPVISQPEISHPLGLNADTAICHAALKIDPMIKRTSASEVVRSQSMRSLRKSLESSPTRNYFQRHPEVIVNDLESSPVKIPAPVLEEGSAEDICRLRNFSITSKGLVNYGDSFRSRSMTFVPCTHVTSPELGESSTTLPYRGHPQSSTDCTSGGPFDHGLPSKHRVAILGSSEVGKTTMIRQFRTSEYICAFDSSDESSDGAITIVLNGVESELEFIDQSAQESEDGTEDKSEKTSVPNTDAYVIVYSVTNRRSFLYASDLLDQIRAASMAATTVVLVGNKSDLVRTRTITTDEGRNLAKERGCKFIETSVAINHQVDELLVDILTQIRTKKQLCACAMSRSSYSQYSLSRAKGLLKKLLKKACFQSKSCDNLQRL